MSNGTLRWVVKLLMIVIGLPGSVSGAGHSHPNPDVEIRHLAEGVWLHISHHTFPNGDRFPSNGLIVREGRELTLIDTAWGELETLRLLEAIASEIGQPVTKAIVTHSHSDRAAGVDVLESHGVEVYAHPLTQRFTIENGLPVPDRTIEGLSDPGDTRTIGSIEVIYPGPAHAPDNVMVWLPAQRILFGGCAVRARASKSAGNTSHADIESWLEALSVIAKRYTSAEIVVPGHGEPGGHELIRHTSRLVREARDTSSSTEVNAQQDVSLYQYAPAQWRAEVIPFPLPFAPGLKLEGVEELRFAPGMFEPSSETYFTYTFIWWLKGQPQLGPVELERHLLQYFRGLYAAVSKKDEKDVSSFSVRIKQAQSSASTELSKEHYQGSVSWTDPFTTEEKIALNLKLWRWYCRDEDRSAVFFALSPKPYAHANWKIMGGQKAGQCQ